MRDFVEANARCPSPIVADCMIERSCRVLAVEDAPSMDAGQR
jgi:hypothetical protein